MPQPRSTIDSAPTSGFAAADVAGAFYRIIPLAGTVRRFSPDYLAETRRGLWDDRSALVDADLAQRNRILEVGCGSGEFTRILAEESGAEIIALDADRRLLERVTSAPRVAGDATRLPFVDDAFDLVIGQALLINLPSPSAAVSEFARVSNDLVASIEPDNTAVRVKSTVQAEADLSERAREAFIGGIDTDIGLGHRTRGLFEEAGLTDVTVRYHPHHQRIEPPYSESAVSGAAKKASGSRLEAHRDTLLESIEPGAFDEFREEWRAMGRRVIDQMQDEEYEREELTPFYVTVGSV